jgi:hypothetical protein
MFKVVSQRLPRYKNLAFTPYQMATFIYPDQFLKLNDIYMATLIEMLIATNHYKKILGIFGIMENESVEHLLLNNQALNPVIELLLPPGPKGTIVRDIEPFEIVEKHIILDLMFFSEETLHIKTESFHTTNAAILKYCSTINPQIVMKFRYDKTMEYLNLMKTKIKEGEQEIKK